MSIVNSVLRVPDMVTDLLIYREEMKAKKAAEGKGKQESAPAGGDTTQQQTTPAPSGASTYTAPKDYRNILAMPGRRL